MFVSSNVTTADSTDSPHIATPTGPDTPTLLSADDDPKPKVDPRAEVSRLMKQLRSGKQDITPKPFPVPSTPPKKVEKKAWRKSLFVKSGPWTPEVPEEDPLVTVCRDVMEEMGVGNRLLKFCCELPILLNLSRGGNAFASSSDVGSTEEGDPGIAPLIKRWVWHTIIFPKKPYMHSWLSVLFLIPPPSFTTPPFSLLPPSPLIPPSLSSPPPPRNHMHILRYGPVLVLSVPLL